MPSFQKGLSKIECGFDSPLKLSNPPDLSVAESGPFGHVKQAPDPLPLEDAELRRCARGTLALYVINKPLNEVAFHVEEHVHALLEPLAAFRKCGC